MTTYYISTGLKSKMYTLRCSIPSPTHINPDDVSDSFVKRLSTNVEKAESMAKKYTGLDIKVSSDIILGDIKKELTYQHMPNGKYQGTLYTELPVEYLTWWVFNYSITKSYSKLVSDINSYIESNIDDAVEKYTKLTFGKWKGTTLKDVPTDYLEYIMGATSDNICKKAVKLELDNRVDEVEQEEVKIQHEWVGNIKDRLDVKVLIKKQHSYLGTDYHGNEITKYMTVMNDENGNIFVYFGNILNDLDIDAWYIVKMTIKDHSYRNTTKQNIINRPKVN